MRDCNIARIPPSLRKNRKQIPCTSYLIADFRWGPDAIEISPDHWETKCATCSRLTSEAWRTAALNPRANRWFATLWDNDEDTVLWDAECIAASITFNRAATDYVTHQMPIRMLPPDPEEGWMPSPLLARLARPVFLRLTEAMPLTYPYPPRTSILNSQYNGKLINW